MKRLRIRKNCFLLALALFLGMGTSFAAQFSAVCSTGQTLYYNIISTTDHQVQLTFPGNYSTPYPSNFPKPTGNITLPSAVSYNGETYTVVMIGPRTFMNCSGLTGSLTIPNSVIEIGDNAFDGCTGFTGNLTVGNSVTKIDYMAFSGCSGFTGSLTLFRSCCREGFWQAHFDCLLGLDCRWCDWLWPYRRYVLYGYVPLGNASARFCGLPWARGFRRVRLRLRWTLGSIHAVCKVCAQGL